MPKRKRPKARALRAPAEYPGRWLPWNSCVVDDAGWDEAHEEVVLHCYDATRKCLASYEMYFRCCASVSKHLWAGGYYLASVSTSDVPGNRDGGPISTKDGTAADDVGGTEYDRDEIGDADDADEFGSEDSYPETEQVSLNLSAIRRGDRSRASRHGFFASLNVPVCVAAFVRACKYLEIELREDLLEEMESRLDARKKGKQVHWVGPLAQRKTPETQGEYTSSSSAPIIIAGLKYISWNPQILERPKFNPSSLPHSLWKPSPEPPRRSTKNSSVWSTRSWVHTRKSMPRVRTLETVRDTCLPSM